VSGDAEGEKREVRGEPTAALDPAPILPPKGALLGIDFGTVRVGIAVCDPDRIIASALETYTRTGPAADAAYITRLVSQQRAVGFVVGLPLHSNGDESEKSCEARAYARWLSEVTRLPTVLWDERFTTSLAQDAMIGANLNRKKRKERVDRVAAQMILQVFLDAGCPAGGSDAIFTDTSSPEPHHETDPN
jgi:putative Holliday junction resolvase